MGESLWGLFLAIRGARALLLALTGVLVGLILGAVVLLVTAPAAHADHSVVDHVSQGVSGGNGSFAGSFQAASKDGSVVLFETNEPLVAADTDTASDVYRRAGGVTELATAGPAGTGPDFPNLTGLTPDGSTVLFYTRDALVAGDTDTIDDAYMYRAGTTTLLSPGPNACPGSQSWPFLWSDDGGKVFIQSTDRLTAGDTDCNSDAYQYSAGTVTLVQPGPGATSMVGVSADGNRVFFTSSDALVAEDSDAMNDLYMRDGAALTLISTGPSGGNGPFNAFATYNGGPSAAGDRIYFSTAESLVSADTDGAVDTYLWDNGAIDLVTTGPAGGNSPTATHQVWGSSDDGSHVIFVTDEQLVAADTDSRSDIYDHSAGTTSLVSTGPAGGNGAFTPDVLQNGISADGSRVYFQTREKLVASDNNQVYDLYVHTGGQTNLAVLDSSGVSVPAVSLYGISADGTKVFFSTTQSLVPADTDGKADIYERSGSITTLVSLGPAGGNGPVDTVQICCPPNIVSDNGSRVFFHTTESLVNTDADSVQDLYSASVAPGPPAGAYPRPRGATPLRVSLVPAFQLCTSQNRTHGPPLAFGSCNPPALESTQLTVGTPDANGQAAASEGFARYQVLVGNPATSADEADVGIEARITDVRVQGTLADYTGTLGLVSTVRITDKNSGTGSEPATLIDREMRAYMTCAVTAGAEGATCSVNTSFDAIAPGTIVESRRSIWELDRVRVFDGGADGNAFSQPNTLFATQGLFVP